MENVIRRLARLRILGVVFVVKNITIKTSLGEFYLGRQIPHLSLNFRLMLSPLMSLIKETLRNFLLAYFSLTACSL